MSTEQLTVQPKFVDSATSIVARAEAARTITTPEAYLVAVALVLDSKAMLKEIDKGYDDLIATAHQAHKDTIAKKAGYANPHLAAVKILSPEITKWDLEQRRIAEAETLRLQKIEDDRQAELQIKTAVALEDVGATRLAEQVINEPKWTAPAVVLPRATPAVSGVSKPRDNWKAVIKTDEDFMLLVKAVAEGKAPVQCLEANESFLNNQAKQFMNKLNIPGVVAVNSPITAFTPGRR
jgi:hypothetical protein